MGLFFILGFCGQAFATYSISYIYVQHRAYEDPAKGVNRLYFQIKDGENFVRNDLLTSVKLFNPSNNALKLPDLTFYPHDYGVRGEYNANMGQYTYDGVVHDESGYSGNIDVKKLVKGTYRLVATYNGFKIETACNFNGLVNLPVIDDKSIKASMDPKGNLFCTWKVPNSAFYLTEANPALAVSARAIIDVYNGETAVAYVQPFVPFHMGQAFFPARIVELIKTELGGNTYKFRVQLRTNDNNNRTFSDYVDITTVLNP